MSPPMGCVILSRFTLCFSRFIEKQKIQYRKHGRRGHGPALRREKESVCNALLCGLRQSCDLGTVIQMQNHVEIERFPVRKNPRMQNFDYAAPYYYFITVCTHEKEWIFGTPGKLSAYGKIARECFLEIEKHFPNTKADKWTVMPNHVHGIIILSGNVELSTVVGLYKSAVTKRIHGNQPDLKVWQTSFHDHVIRNQADYERIWQYIDTNVARWTEDCFYTPQKL